MRVAPLYDIHGNIDALDAVLNEIQSQDIDLIVIGGDIAWGPFPAEAVSRVEDLAERARVIRGNADRELVEPDAAESGWIADVNRWCLEQLSPHQQRFLSDLPETEVVSIEELGEVLFCHATPRSDDETFTAMTPEEDAASILAGVNHGLIVCGHTHSQFDRRVAGHRVVNAGSVGLPYEDAPGAYWAIIDEDIQHRRTVYDFARAAARIRRSGCPHADEFAEGIISPPSRAEATESFENRRAGRHDN